MGKPRPKIFKPDDPQGDDPELLEMTVTELRAEVVRLRAQLRALTLSGPPGPSDQPATGFEDASGRILSRVVVEGLAARNIRASGEGSSGVALYHYLKGLSDLDLLQWATDEDGNFPAELFGG